MKKDCMFQYALGRPPLGEKTIIESTDLITRKEADELWNKYYSDCIKKLENGNEPQMCIWIDCKNDTNYHATAFNKSIDYRDNLVVENGKIYILEKRELF